MGRNSVRAWVTEMSLWLTYFVLAIHVADFPASNTYISSRNVRRGMKVSKQFSHERFAKTTDFCFALAFGIKITSTLAPSHGKSSKGIFEDLLEA